MSAKKTKNLEQILEELEEIVKKMESKDTGLNENIKLYEKAVELTKAANELLAEYKGRITVLTDVTEKIEESFD